MPTYQYECEQCNAQFEVFKSIKDNSEVNCNKCNTKAKKVYSSFGIVFNGSGFYSTDNRKK